MFVEICFVVILTFGNLFCWVPFLISLIFRKIQYFHRHVTSDIPGNPHAFDNSIISLMRTLPEPSNFNLCWTGLSLNEPIRICGEMPPARINSITIYPRGTSDPPVTLDLASLPFSTTPDRHRMINVLLTSSDENESSHPPSPTTQKKYRCGILKYPKHWKNGFIAMRNFCVPYGTLVITPELTRLSDNKILRPSETLVAGLTSLYNLELFKIQRILLLNLLLTWILFSYFHVPLSSILLILILSLSLMNLFIYQLYQIGKRGLFKHVSDIVPHKHEFKLPDLMKASQASQPSLDHRYWIMKYDLKASNYDLLIQFTIQRNYQKYWSVVVYDEYGIPLSQFYNLENIIHFPENGIVSCNFNPKDSSQYVATIRLTRFPSNCHDSSLVLANEEDDPSSSSSSSSAATTTTSTPPPTRAHGTIDIQKATNGYVIFRIVHPTNEKVIQLSSPRVRLAGHSPTSTVPNAVQGGYFIDKMM